MTERAMTERKLTPAEHDLAAETAAVIEADVRVSLTGKPVTPANIGIALFEAVNTLSVPGAAIIVEQDPDDPNRLNVFMSLGRPRKY
jgi:hypothetical protein